MTLNKTALAAIISLSALLGFSGSALAQNGMGGHMNGGMNYQNSQGMYHGGAWFNLTPDQQAASQKVFDEFQTATADMRQQLLSKQYEYNALLTSKPVDDQKILAVSKEIQALRDGLYQQRVKMDTEFAKAGVPMMGNHRGMGGNHMGMRGGRGCR